MDLNDFKEFLSFSKNEKIRISLFILSTVVSGFIIVFSLNPQYIKELNPLTLIILSIAAILPVWCINQVFWFIIWNHLLNSLFTDVLKRLNISKEAKESLLSKDKGIGVSWDFQFSVVADFLTIFSTYIAAGIVFFVIKSLILLYLIIIIINALVFLFIYQVIYIIFNKLDKDQINNLLYQPIVDKLKKNKEFVQRLDKRLKRIEDEIKKRSEKQSEKNNEEKA